MKTAPRRYPDWPAPSSAGERAIPFGPIAEMEIVTGSDTPHEHPTAGSRAFRSAHRASDPRLARFRRPGRAARCPFGIRCPSRGQLARLPSAVVLLSWFNGPFPPWCGHHPRRVPAIPLAHHRREKLVLPGGCSSHLHLSQHVPCSNEQLNQECGKGPDEQGYGATKEPEDILLAKTELQCSGKQV